MLKLEKNYLYKTAVILMCLLWTGAALAYETGEFEAPVDLGNGLLEYEGSIFSFEKDTDTHDSNKDGIDDTRSIKYSNDQGIKIYKRQVINNEHEGKTWEWVILKNLTDRNHLDNYNLTDQNGDGIFNMKSQYLEDHPWPGWRVK